MQSINQLCEEMRSVLDEYGVENISDTILTLEIKSAIGAINRCRRFKPNGAILYDETYEDKIIPLAVTGYLKAGAEGENSHTENGVTRRYGDANKYPKEMLQDIIPLAKFY